MAREENSLLFSLKELKGLEEDRQREEEDARLADELRQAGHTPYVIPVGGSNAIGTLGYASAMHELAGQLGALEMSVSRLYFSSGSGGTHAGLLLGQHLFGPANLRLVGVSPSNKAEVITDKIASIANDAAQQLGLNVAFSPDNVLVYDQFVGLRYGMGPEVLKAANPGLELREAPIGMMEGEFYCVTEDVQFFEAKIEPFALARSKSLH